MIVVSSSVPVFTLMDFALSCAAISSNSNLSRPLATRAFRNRTKAVRSGVRSDLENPQTRRNELLSSSASASFTSARSYQIDRSSALNRAKGGRAASPLAALEMQAKSCSTGAQSTSLDSLSRDDHLTQTRMPPAQCDFGSSKPPSFDKGIESSTVSLVQNHPRTGLISGGGNVTSELFAFLALHTRNLVHPGELL